jgi:ethanolamine utilization protein EutA
MHDFLFDHLHFEPADQETLWHGENVSLTTVGIDIGSATSHLAFSRLDLRRRDGRLATVQRKELWRSPILLTPYRVDTLIDVDFLGQFVAGCYDEAGIEPDRVDSGAVILTGHAAERPNAGEIGALFAHVVGRYACATAGHRLEAIMAARGSGAVQISRERAATVLNVDIGGGTTKFALIADGEIVATAAIAAGARLGKERDHARAWRLGESIVAAIRGEPVPERLHLTAPLPRLPAPEAVVFSGGVAEYIFDREHRRFDDLGPGIARAIQDALVRKTIVLPVWDTGAGIRATAAGACQFTVQAKGGTATVSHPERLPLRNVPVVASAAGETLDDALRRADLGDAEAIAVAGTLPPPCSGNRTVVMVEGLALRPLDYVDVLPGEPVELIVKSLVF